MKSLDKALGIDTTITRRDFVGSMLIGAGSALLGCTSPPKQLIDKTSRPVSYTHLTLPTTPYV